MSIGCDYRGWRIWLLKFFIDDLEFSKTSSELALAFHNFCISVRFDTQISSMVTLHYWRATLEIEWAFRSFRWSLDTSFDHCFTFEL